MYSSCISVLDSDTNQNGWKDWEPAFFEVGETMVINQRVCRIRCNITPLMDCETLDWHLAGWRGKVEGPHCQCKICIARWVVNKLRMRYVVWWTYCLPARASSLCIFNSLGLTCNCWVLLAVVDHIAVSRWGNGLGRLQQWPCFLHRPGFESHLRPVEFFACNKGFSN